MDSKKKKEIEAAWVEERCAAFDFYNGKLDAIFENPDWRTRKYMKEIIEGYRKLKWI